MAATDVEPLATAASNGCTNCFRSGRIESWTKAFNEIDEALSRPVFRLGLPKWLEFVASFPANIFGSTACLTTGPLWVALAAIAREPYSYGEGRIALLRIIAFLMTTLHVACWGSFQAGRHRLGRRLFWNTLLYPLAYPWIVGILACTVLGLDVDDSGGATHGSTPKEIFSMAIYPLVLWPPVVIVMAELKNATRRSRPVTKDLARLPNGERWIERKKFPHMSRWLAERNGDQSFPSGDVAMAVLVLALPLWHVEGHRNLAMAIALTSALGRMYVLAHHLSDVVAGFLLALWVHRTAAALGYGMHHVEWWHPFLAMGSYVVLHHLTNAGANSMARQGGRKGGRRESKAE